MRSWVGLIALLGAGGLWVSGGARGATLEEVRTGLHQLAIDPQQTYRVRELQFSRGGVKIYLTEGVLAFATPIDGRRIAAVFTTQQVDAGDAEILAFPPNRAERASLASFSGSPNLDEHFRSALFFFGDNTAEELLAQIRQRAPRPAAEIGSELAKTGDGVLRSNADELDVSLAASLLDRHRPETGFFYAMILGRDKGTFDFAYQPNQPDPVTFGRLAQKGGGEARYFQVWSAFRAGVPEPPAPANVVNDYRIEVTVRKDLGMSADARFDYVVQEGDGRVISLLLTPRLQVQSAEVDGQPAQVYQHVTPLLEKRGSGAGPFLIIAQAELAAGTHHQVAVKYEGSIVHKTARGSYFVDDRSAWYPFISPVRATFDLTFHCPEAFRLVSTGEAVSEDVAGGLRTVHRRTSAPGALAGFNLGEYSVRSSQRGPYRIEVYSNPSGELAVDIPAQTADILDRYTALWGALPWRSVAVSPIEGYFGQGFPGLIYLSDISFQQEEDRPAALRNPRLDAFFTQMLLPHEIAHQWWGNIVAPADYRSNWILEGLANYVALQYLEAARGRAVRDEILNIYRGELTASKEGAPVDAHGPVVFGERLLSNYGPGVWHDVIYEKGAWIFHMLRLRLGDSGFNELEHRLLRDFAAKPIANEDLRKEAAGLTPAGGVDRSLNGFFETWVYGTGIPTMSMDGQELSISGVEDDYLADVPLNCPGIGEKRVTRWVHAGSGKTTVTAPNCKLPGTSEFLYR